MILPLALAFAAAIPTDALARSMEDYTECLRVHAGRPDRDAAAERTRFAMAQCGDRREAAIRVGIEVLSTRLSSASAGERVDQALAGVEAIFPAMLRAGGGVEIPLGIAPMVRRYIDCIRDQMGDRGGLLVEAPASYRAAVDASMAFCAAARTAATAESEAVLSRNPDFADADRRHLAINRAFDQTDSQQRNLPEILSAVLREQGTNAPNR